MHVSNHGMLIGANNWSRGWNGKHTRHWDAKDIYWILSLVKNVFLQNWGCSDLHHQSKILDGATKPSLKSLEIVLGMISSCEYHFSVDTCPRRVVPGYLEGRGTARSLELLKRNKSDWKSRATWQTLLIKTQQTDSHVPALKDQWKGNEWWQWWETKGLPLVSVASVLSSIFSSISWVFSSALSPISSSTYSVITSAVVTSILPPLLTSVDVERSVVLDGIDVSVLVVEIGGGVDFGPVVVLDSTFFFSSRDCSFFWEALEAFSLFLLLLSFSIVFFSSSSSLPWPEK